eukprot:3612277-Prymnesium_polylepis.1
MPVSSTSMLAPLSPCLLSAPLSAPTCSRTARSRLSWRVGSWSCCDHAPTDGMRLWVLTDAHAAQSIDS